MSISDVRFIRQQRYMTDAQLSEKFSVTVGHIRKIKAGERWARELLPKKPVCCPLSHITRSDAHSKQRRVISQDSHDFTPKLSRAAEISEMISVVENVDRVVDRINKKVGDIIPLLERQEQRLATKVQRAVRLVEESKQLSAANFKRESDRQQRLAPDGSLRSVRMSPPTQKQHKKVLALVPKITELIRDTGVNRLCRIVAHFPHDSEGDVKEAFFLAVRDDLVSDRDKHGTRPAIRPEWSSQDIHAVWDTFNRDRSQSWWDVALALRVSVILARNVIICRLREEAGTNK